MNADPCRCPMKAAAPETALLVEQSLPQGRLDTFLRTRFPTLSRGALQRLIEQGHIRSMIRRSRRRTRRAPESGSSSGGRNPGPHGPTAGHPAGGSVRRRRPAGAQQDARARHASVGRARGRHAGQRVAASLPGQLSGIGGVARPGIVHRLDRETSGCLVVAKNDATHLALSAQFADRYVQKLYHAIVCAPWNRSRATSAAAIARHPTHRKRMAVTDGSGRDAWTSYRILERLREAT